MADDNIQGEVLKEIKKYGDDLKALKDSAQKDLADVRKLAEEAGSKEQIAALSTSVAEKQVAIERLAKEFEAQKARQEGIELALQRAPADSPEAAAKSAKELAEFCAFKSALEGRPADVQADDYAAWASKDGFAKYLRSNDERRVDAKALAVGDNTVGGYLVPVQTSARIITKIFETSPIRQMATVETISTSELEIPVDVDEADCGWVGETQTRSETDTPNVGVQKIPVFEIYAKPKATQRFLEDASINVEQWLANKVGDKMGRTEATAFVSGTGVNQPRGILSYPDGTGREQIEQIVSGSATAISSDSIQGFPFEVKAAYLSNASWLMHRSSIQAVMLLKDDNGQYLWRPGFMGNPPSGGPGTSGPIYQATLCGYPVAMADDMPVIAADALAIAFGDFRRAYTVVDRLGITTLRDPYSAKPNVEFYSRKRVGGAVVDFDAIKLMKIAAAS